MLGSPTLELDKSKCLDKKSFEKALMAAEKKALMEINTKLDEAQKIVDNMPRNTKKENPAEIALKKKLAELKEEKSVARKSMLNAADSLADLENELEAEYAFKKSMESVGILADSEEMADNGR